MCAAKAAALIIPLANLQRVRHRRRTGGCQALAAATQTMLLQIEEEGLGATWLGMYPRKARTDALRAYFQLPEHIMPFAVIALGYKAREKEPRATLGSGKGALGALLSRDQSRSCPEPE